MQMINPRRQGAINCERQAATVRIVFTVNGIGFFLK